MLKPDRKRAAIQDQVPGWAFSRYVLNTRQLVPKFVWAWLTRL